MIINKTYRDLFYIEKKIFNGMKILFAIVFILMIFHTYIISLYHGIPRKEVHTDITEGVTVTNNTQLYESIYDFDSEDIIKQTPNQASSVISYDNTTSTMSEDMNSTKNDVKDLEYENTVIEELNSINSVDSKSTQKKTKLSKADKDYIQETKTSSVVNEGVPTTYPYTDEEIYEIASLVHVEANSQSELGKRLVIDCVLNRVESSKFPNTPSEVISAEGQFTSVRGKPSQDEIGYVITEIASRTNTDVIYFKTKGYHSFASPIIQEDAHYFSGIKN